MNSLSQFESMGFDLPTPAYLLGALLFGIYGYVAYRRGKKIGSSQLRWTGVALMLYPYGVSQTWLLWLVGAALCGWTYLRWE
jgi:hypothetical protein